MTARIEILVIWVFIVILNSSVVNANDVVNTQTAASNSSSAYEQLHESAKSGSANAQYELGLLFEYGRDVNQDDMTAVYWYEKSAAQFFPNALYRLAVLYDYGWGPKSDKEKALSLYLAAAENGHDLAQHAVAIMYFHGSGTPRSLLQAYKWMNIAVIGGNPLMQKHLVMVAKEMSVDEIEVAEYLSIEWLERSSK